jgi:hypothetical protein
MDCVCRHGQRAAGPAGRLVMSDDEARADFLHRVDEACANLPLDGRARVVAVAASYVDDLAGRPAETVTVLADPVAYAREVRAELGLGTDTMYRVDTRTPRRGWIVPLTIGSGIAAVATLLVFAIVLALQPNASNPKAGEHVSKVARSSYPHRGTPTPNPVPAGYAYLGRGFWTIKVDHLGHYEFRSETFRPVYPLRDFSASLVVFDGLVRHDDNHGLRLVDAGNGRIRLVMSFDVGSYRGHPVLAITAEQRKPRHS